jgi:spore coat polysaccharide biosynthesis protein SpsF
MELEIFTFAALKKAWQNAVHASDREHVTPYIYRTAGDKFRLFELPYKEDLSNYRLTIDYDEDFYLIKKIFEHLYPKKTDFGLNDIIKLFNEYPELTRINAEKADTQI